MKLNSGHRKGEGEKTEQATHAPYFLPKMLLVPIMLLSLAGSFDCANHVIFAASFALRGHDTRIDFSCGFCL